MGKFISFGKFEDPLPLILTHFFNFGNFGIASIVHRSFFQRCECRDCIRTQLLVLSCVLTFLDDVSTSQEETCLDAASYMFTCLPSPVILSPMIINFRNLVDPSAYCYPHLLWVLRVLYFIH